MQPTTPQGWYLQQQSHAHAIAAQLSHATQQHTTRMLEKRDGAYSINEVLVQPMSGPQLRDSLCRCFSPHAMSHLRVHGVRGGDGLRCLEKHQ